MIGVKKEFDDGLGEGEAATFEAIAVGAGRHARRAQGRRMVALPAQQRLPMVQCRRPLELRAGQIVEARRRRRRSTSTADAPAKISAQVGWGSHRLDIKSRRRRPDQHHLRRRLVGHGERRHARQCRRDARQGELQAPGDASQAAHRLALRRQGDDRAGRRQDRAAHRHRPRRRRQRRAVRSRRGLGRRRLRRGPHASPARRQGQAHAGRALGLAWFGIDEAARKLDVSLGAPDKARPRQTMSAADQDRRPRARRGGRGHRRRRRCRHPQYHRLSRRPIRSDYFFGQRKLPSKSATSTAC